VDGRDEPGHDGVKWRVRADAGHNAGE